MADFDPSTAEFIQQAYRYAIQSDASILARNPTARVVQIDTQLGGSGAAGLATKYLNANAAPRAYEIVLEGVMFLDTLVGACPSFILNFPKFKTDNRPLKLISFTTDLEANTTTVQVRG